MRDEVDVRPWTADDVTGLVEMAERNGMRGSRAGLMVQLEHQRLAERRPDLHTFRRLVAEVDGEIVGTAMAHDDLFLPRRWLVARLHVSRQHRRLGVGRSLARELERMLPLSTAGVETSVPVGDGVALAWAEAWGFDHHVMDVTCHLALERPTPVGLNVGHVQPDGIDLFSLAEKPGSDARLHRLVADLIADIPGSQPGSGPPVEVIGSTFDHLVSIVPEATWVAVRGDRWVGVTLTTDCGEKGALYTWFTGVAPSERGHGLATVLKLRSITSARSLGVHSMVSQTHATNTAMLALNRRLGGTHHQDVRIVRRSHDRTGPGCSV